MLVPQAYLNCCFYIYPSKQLAEQGAQIGATGFLVAVPIPSDTTLAIQLYAVTAMHVIKKLPNPVLRVNTVPGGFDCIETNRDRWTTSEDADLATIPIELEYESYRYWFIRIEEFVDAANTSAIGPGDDTFMVGRFVNQDGKQENTPTARFGNIAMMPDEQHVFLVEHRSLPGYSGSPVFVWINPGLPRLPSARISISKSYEPEIYGPWLLGVDSCHIQDYNPLLNSKDEADLAKPPKWTKSNTGLAEVVPAWKLAELLNSDALAMLRKNDAIAIDAKNINAESRLDSAAPGK